MPSHTDVAGRTDASTTMWHPMSPEGLAITRVQLDATRASQRSGPRVLLAANSHVDLRSDGHGDLNARVSVSQPSAATLRLHLYRADGRKIRTVEVPSLVVTDTARWKEWRAEFRFPAAEYAELSAVDLDFDDVPNAERCEE